MKRTIPAHEQSLIFQWILLFFIWYCYLTICNSESVIFHINSFSSQTHVYVFFSILDCQFDNVRRELWTLDLICWANVNNFENCEWANGSVQKKERAREREREWQNEQIDFQPDKLLSIDSAREMETISPFINGTVYWKCWCGEHAVNVLLNGVVLSQLTPLNNRKNDLLYF